MGLYDRDYVRDEPRGFFLGGDRSMVVNLIVVNVVVFLIDVFADSALAGRAGKAGILALQADLFQHPVRFYQLLTCGFVHDTKNLLHIGFNMFALWMFGSPVEGIYGRREFLLLYLWTVVLGSLAWVVSQSLQLPPPLLADAHMIGASGAVTCVVVLFVLHFPRQTLLIFGIVPVPAWLVGVVIVGQDLLGYSNSLHGAQEGTAFEVHLAGALVAGLYWWTGFRFSRWWPTFKGNWRLRSPKLRVHRPPGREQDLAQQVDRILEKLHREGESSLTKQERRTLEDASRRYQERRK